MKTILVFIGLVLLFALLLFAFAISGLLIVFYPAWGYVSLAVLVAFVGIVIYVSEKRFNKRWEKWER